jgi:hypothetical protein
MQTQGLILRGQTLYGPTATIDSADLAGREVVGTEKYFDDRSPITGTPRSNRLVKCRLVRNTSGGTMYAKRCVALKAGTNGTEIVGNGTALAQPYLYPIDEYLVNGVRNNDCCWIVTSGPALVLTDLAGADNNVIAQGARVVGLTGATTGATTAGRVMEQVLTGATALLAAQVQNAIGVAMSAKTTTQTNSDLLVDVRGW